MQIIPKTILIVLNNNNEDNDHRGNQSNQSENNYLKAEIAEPKKPSPYVLKLGPCKRD